MFMRTGECKNGLAYRQLKLLHASGNSPAVIGCSYRTLENLSRCSSTSPVEITELTTSLGFSTSRAPSGFDAHIAPSLQLVLY